MELSISLCVTGSVLERYEQELTILVRVGDDVVERCMDVKLCVRAQMEPSVMRAPLEKLLELGKKPLLGGEGTSSSPRVGPVIPPKELMSVMQWVLIQSRDMPPGTLQWWANPMREPSSRSARSARSARGNACLSCWVWQRRFDTRTHTL
eukprot:g27567.t1